jgi:hypothetical protein
MPTNTNLAGIRDMVKEWSQRRNIPDDTIDAFIEIGLSRACRQLRIPPLEGVTSIVPSADGYIELPNDFQEVKELSVPNAQGVTIFERKAIHQVDAVAGSYDALDVGKACMLNGVPLTGSAIFARVGNFLRVAPWDASVSINLYYNKILFPLQSDTSTNWFTDYAPELLLYGAMSELSAYTRDNEGMQIWDRKFSGEVSTLQGVEDRAAWMGSTLAISVGGST